MQFQYFSKHSQSQLVVRIACCKNASKVKNVKACLHFVGLRARLLVFRINWCIGRNTLTRLLSARSAHSVNQRNSWVDWRPTLACLHTAARLQYLRVHHAWITRTDRQTAPEKSSCHYIEQVTSCASSRRLLRPGSSRQCNKRKQEK